MGGMGGWRGSMGTVGGLTRTYGLQRHFTREQDKQRQGVSSASFSRIARYFRPYLGKWIIVMVCIAATAGLTVLPPFCVAMILDRAIPEQDPTLLAMLVGAMVGLAVAIGLIGVLQQSLTASAGHGMLFDLRNQLFQHLQRMSLRFFTATRSGEIVSRVNNDVNAVQSVAMNTLVSIARDFCTLAATAVAMLSMNWRLTLIAVAIVPLFYLPSRIVGRIRRRLSAQTQQNQAALTAFLSERLHVGGSMLMQIYGRQRADSEQFSEHSRHVRDLNIRQAVVGRWLFMILSIFSAVGPALIFWYGGHQVMREQMTTGHLVAFAALLTMLYRPLTQLMTVYVDVQGAVAVFERIFEYLDMPRDVADRPDATPLPVVRGHIAFENVSFAYPSPPALLYAVGPEGGNQRGQMADQADEAAATRAGNGFALRDVSFTIEPGQRVALVGPSGAGKTTITYLLPRFYDPDEGRITLDGHDLRDLRQDELRSHIAMVTQETFLFHADIRENLLYARPDADESQMIEACRAANIHEFICELPDGYKTIVGERGFRLSGGEKQRLSIARALLKDPSILILDEATSSLDATSEHLVQTALARLMDGRTSLIIAHRLSTILHADRIVVMEGGQVADIGRHEELLARGGLYADLFHKQFAGVLEHNHATM